MSSINIGKDDLWHDDIIDVVNWILLEIYFEVQEQRLWSQYIQKQL